MNTDEYDHPQHLLYSFTDKMQLFLYYSHILNLRTQRSTTLYQTLLQYLNADNTLNYTNSKQTHRGQSKPGKPYENLFTLQADVMDDFIL